jgi:DNA ligase-1
LQSQGKNIAIIKKLLASCSSSKDPTQDHSNEAKYLIRSLEGKLRIHLAEKTVLVALAHAAVHSQPANPNSTSKQVKVDPSDLPRAEEVVKAVFSELPSYDIVVPALLQSGWRGLKERCKLTPGVPLKPMLAKPTKSIGEVLDRFEGREFTCEYKYDGERAQIHFIPPKEGGKGGGETKVYSRNSEDMSKRYPDIVEQLPRIIKPEGRGKGGFVLDCECVAWDAKEERYVSLFIVGWGVNGVQVTSVSGFEYEKEKGCAVV